MKTPSYCVISTYTVFCQIKYISIALNITILNKYRGAAARNSTHRVVNCKTSSNSSSEGRVEYYNYCQSKV